MRHPTSTCTARFSASLVLAFAVGAAACGDNNPTAPSPLMPSTQPVVRSIEIGGTTTLQRPGDVVQLTATATYSDGTSRDVTSEVTWSVDHREMVSVGRNGLLTAHSYGQCNVTVSYASVSARVAVRVIPDGMFALSGRISDETGLPLSAATVSITSSPDALSTSTNRDGVYTLPARGDTEVRAEIDGFEAQVRRVNVVVDQLLDFQLKIETNGFGGIYRLTFIAAASCALPPDAMRRTYLARVVEGTGGSLSVTLTGAEFVVWGEAGFTGRRDGSRVQFTVRSDFIEDFAFVELLDPDRELAFSGTAAGDVGDTFVTTFSGSVSVRQRSGVQLARCDAGDHRFEFTR